jgi:hypothetical protein
MQQRKSTSEAQAGAPSTTTRPPVWMQPRTSYSPERRAKMLEHMARARSVPQVQAAQNQATQTLAAATSSRMTGWDILREAYGCIVLSAIVALIFQSRAPFYLGAFMFLTNGERIERVLAMTGIRFEPGAIGPDIVKDFVSLFGWFVLLVSLRDAVPTWLVPQMPPAEPPWPFIAGFALAFVIVEALATRAVRRVLPWFGIEISSNGLIWATIKLVLIISLVALLRLL